jgi:hypothetical protein
MTTFVVEDLFDLFVASWHGSITVFKATDARMLFGTLDYGEETVDTEGRFSLNLLDEILIRLER